MPRQNVETRLTPFEHYMLADDRQSLPMRFGFRMKLRGQLDLVRFRDAFNSAVREQPLLCATISRSFGTWRWNLEEFQDGADHPGWEQNNSQMRWDFDLTREPGIRVNISQLADSIEIWVIVHHSCADGRAVLRFLSDWFSTYNNCEKKPGVLANPVEELAQRGMGRNRPLWRCFFPYGKEWNRIWNFYANPIKPLRVKQRSVNDILAKSKPTFISRRIAYRQDHWQNLKTQLPSDATMNDVLLANVFIAIKQWNESNGSDPKRDWIRVSMPMNLPSDRTGLSSNSTSMVFLDRRADRIKDVKSLIVDIHLETMKIKRHDLGFVFTDVLRILNSIPGGMKLGLLKSFACTTVVSNLGVLNDFILPDSLPGETKMKLEELDFLVPVRRGTAAAIGIASVEETLHLCMNYDPDQLPTESANLFFGGLGNRLAEFLDVNSDLHQNVSVQPDEIR